MGTTKSRNDPRVSRIRSSSRRLVRELGLLQNRCAETDASYAEGHVLIEVERRGPLTVGELADLLGLNKSSTSRTVAASVERGWLLMRPDPSDRRRKPVALTPAGRAELKRIHGFADRQVRAALEQLAPEERDAVVAGLGLYAKALARSRARVCLRPIRKSDDEAIARIILETLGEFGLSGDGCAATDAEIQAMSRAYSGPRSAYFVVLRDGPRGEVLGGCGIGPLEGGDEVTCELRKMYLRPEARGLGLGRQLLERCFEAAREFGYRHCYIETIERMHDARAMYERAGAVATAPLGATGHFQCDRMYVKEL